MTEIIKKLLNDSAFNKKTARQVKLTRLIIFFERVWAPLWPFLSTLGLFIAASLFDLWSYFPFWIHSLGLLSVILSGYLSLRRSIRELRWPDMDEASRRLERQNSVPHRPIDALQDHPAKKPDQGAKALWQVHQKRMATQIERLKTQGPRTRFARIDPRAIRALILILLVVGFIQAGSDWDRRLGAALTLHFGGSPEHVAMDIWITPPDYTNRQPRALTDSGKPVEVIVGSTITARLQGGWRTPELHLHDAELAFTEIAEDSYEISSEIYDGSILEVIQGSKLRGSWPLKIIPDLPPEAGFAATPEATTRNSLKIDYVIRDDFGVTETILSLRKPGTAIDDVLEIELSGAPGGAAVNRTAYQDLTAHPWAGWMVNAELVASDALDQKGRGEKIQFRLPERLFNHPVARNLVNIRKSLFVDPDNRDGPSRRLQSQSRRREQFNDDLVVFIALRSAYWRLRRDDDIESVTEVTDILWNTALRLEDGMVSLAERDMREALEDLSRALQDGSDGSALDQLADALEQSLQNFLMAELANQQSQQSPPSGMPQQGSQMIGSDILQSMIQQMRDLAAAGETEAAMAMLDSLRDILENLSTGGETMSAEDYARMMAASEALSGLQQLQDAQQELMNRTARESLLNAMRDQIGQPQRGMEGLAQQQSDLREVLKGLAEKLGEAGMDGPSELGEAGGAMQGAATALGQGSGRQAVRGQGEALDALGRAVSELEDALSQSMAQSQAASRGIDPLGRSSPFGQGNIEIPSASEMERVRQILQMLQDRIGDPTRPEIERNYLRRLLKRF